MVDRVLCSIGRRSLSQFRRLVDRESVEASNARLSFVILDSSALSITFADRLRVPFAEKTLRFFGDTTRRASLRIVFSAPARYRAIDLNATAAAIRNLVTVHLFVNERLAIGAVIFQIALFTSRRHVTRTLRRGFNPRLDHRPTVILTVIHRFSSHRIHTLEKLPSFQDYYRCKINVRFFFRLRRDPFEGTDDAAVLSCDLARYFIGLVFSSRLFLDAACCCSTCGKNLIINFRF